MNSLAEASIAYRAKHKLNQEALAKLCRVTRPTIVRAEAGKSVSKRTAAMIRLVVEEGSEFC